MIIVQSSPSILHYRDGIEVCPFLTKLDLGIYRVDIIAMPSSLG